MEDQVIITPFNPINEKEFLPSKKYHMYNLDIHYYYQEPVSPGSDSYCSETKSFSLDKFSEFIEYIKTDEKAWKPIKVGKKGSSKDIVDTSVRSSMTLNKKYCISKLYDSRFNYNGDDEYAQYNSHFRPTIQLTDCYDDNQNDDTELNVVPLKAEHTRFNTDAQFCGISNMKLIRYQEGDHFDTFHYDTFKAYKNASMIGTALIFPPNTINQFTGGELVFKVDEDDQELTYTVNPASFTQWTLVTFGKLLHKANPITSGIRYVIKGEIWSMFPNITKPIDCDMAMLDSCIASHYSKGPDVQASLLAQIQEKIKNFFDTSAKDMLDAGERDLHDKNVFTIKEYEEIDDLGCLKPRKETIEFTKGYKQFLEELNKMKTVYNDTVNFKIDVSKVKTFEQTDDFKNIFILDELYEKPYDYNKFKPRHLMKIKKLLLDGWKVSLFNRSFSKFIPYDECDYWTYGNQISITNKGHYNWIVESEQYPGQVIKKTSEYNDQSGDDITIYYESTCLYCWK
jgi:hypothetical protein